MELWPPWCLAAAISCVALGVVIGAFRTGVRGGERWPMRLTGIAASVAIFTLASAVALVQVGCEEHGPLIGSPDRRHVARVMVSLGSAMSGPSVAEVILRPSWSPLWRQVYSGEGDADALGINEPRVYWVDNSHLVVDYPMREDLIANCKTEAGDIVVICRHR